MSNIKVTKYLISLIYSFNSKKHDKDIDDNDNKLNENGSNKLIISSSRTENTKYEIYESNSNSTSTINISEDTYKSINKLKQKEILNEITSNNNNGGNQIVSEYTPSNSYENFMNINKDFFSKIGFKDISDDPIFKLDKEAPKNSMTSGCEICLKEFSRFFKRVRNW